RGWPRERRCTRGPRRASPGARRPNVARLEEVVGEEHQHRGDGALAAVVSAAVRGAAPAAAVLSNGAARLDLPDRAAVLAEGAVGLDLPHRAAVLANGAVRFYVAHRAAVLAH